MVVMVLFVKYTYIYYYYIASNVFDILFLYSVDGTQQ